MKFITVYDNAKFTVRNQEPMQRDGNGTVLQWSKPLRAVFFGHPAIFDSVAAQAANGWSDDERLQVERHLLSHRSFNRSKGDGIGGLYLAPGEVIPEEHADLVKPAPAEAAPKATVDTAPEERCSFVTTGDTIEQCPNLAVDGDLCAEHAAEAASTEGAPSPEPKPRTRSKAKSAA